MANGTKNHFPARKKMEQKSLQLASWTVDTSIRTRRQVGRPKRRWEDDLNEFLKTEEGQEKSKYDLKNNNSWMDEIQDYKNGKKMKKSSQRSGSALFEPKSLNCVSSVLPQTNPHSLDSLYR